MREKRIAQSVSAFQWSIKGQSVFMVDATAAPGHTAEELQREIDAVLAEVRERGVTPEEVRRARNKIETDFVAGLQSVGGMSGKADRMQMYNHVWKEPDGFARDLARYEAVTPQMVQAFAKEFLGDRRAVLRAPPAQSAQSEQQPAQKKEGN